jgi:hypothetical protein
MRRSERRSAWFALGVVAVAATAGLLMLNWPRATAQDPWPSPTGYTLVFGSDTYTVGEADGTVTLTVYLFPAQTGGPVAVDYATADGSATAGDYVPATGTLVFQAGETSKTITIVIVNDLCTESGEDFTVTLSNAHGATLGSPSTATVTITDDDI